MRRKNAEIGLTAEGIAKVVLRALGFDAVDYHREADLLATYGLHRLYIEVKELQEWIVDRSCSRERRHGRAWISREAHERLLKAEQVKPVRCLYLFIIHNSTYELHYKWARELEISGNNSQISYYRVKKMKPIYYLEKDLISTKKPRISTEIPRRGPRRGLRHYYARGESNGLVKT